MRANAASLQVTLPDPGPMPDADAKRSARMSVALAPELKDEARELAAHQGQTPSALVEMLLRQKVGMLRASGKRGLRDPLLRSIDELRTEAEAALSDGRVTSGERARLTCLLSAQLHMLWGTRRTA